MVVDGQRLLKRLTLIVTEGVIEHVIYPVFPPDEAAQAAIDWLRANPFGNNDTNDREVLYTPPGCRFCEAVKALLTARDVTFEEIDVEWDPEIGRRVVARTGALTFPHILIDGGRYVGGFEELMQLDRQDSFYTAFRRDRRSPPDITIRPALSTDSAALRLLIASAIERLQAGFLTLSQIEASAAFMGLDTQLIEDGTYFVTEAQGCLIGCGGWSRRATLFGGDGSLVERNSDLLDPSLHPARIRAMYTHPTAARQGVGSLTLATCEREAALAGYAEVELMATLSGEPLYRKAGYVAVEGVSQVSNGTAVPFVRMRKGIGRSLNSTRF